MKYIIFFLFFCLNLYGYENENRNNALFNYVYSLNAATGINENFAVEFDFNYGLNNTFLIGPKILMLNISDRFFSGNEISLNIRGTMFIDFKMSLGYLYLNTKSLTYSLEWKLQTITINDEKYYYSLGIYYKMRYFEKYIYQQIGLFFDYSY